MKDTDIVLGFFDFGPDTWIEITRGKNSVTYRSTDVYRMIPDRHFTVGSMRHALGDFSRVVVGGKNRMPTVVYPQ